MADTKIEWAEKVWNPVRGCSRVSPGCQRCYAERMAARFCYVGDSGQGFEEYDKGPSEPFAGFAVRTPSGPRWTGKVKLIEHMLGAPLHWRKPRKVFVNSMSDLFHESLSPILIDRVFAVMALCPQHTFQILTKRPEVMKRYVDDNALVRVNRQIELWMEFREDFPKGRSFPRHAKAWPLPNVWLGVSVEDRARKDRIDVLRQVPAAVRFLSLEPLLEDLGELNLAGIDWVIVGGESGPGARGCHITWVRSIVQQCKAAGVACFVKQLGAYAVLDPRYDRRISGWSRKLRDRKGGDPEEWPSDVRVREYPDVRHV